jgi:heterodisulfide reductase subunit C
MGEYLGERIVRPLTPTINRIMQDHDPSEFDRTRVDPLADTAVLERCSKCGMCTANADRVCDVCRSMDPSSSDGEAVA